MKDMMKIQQARATVPSMKPASTSVDRSKPGNRTFGNVLAEQLRQKEPLKQKEDIVFSRHAVERLHQRNIQLTPNEMDRLNRGFHRAEEKGIRETLIMMDNRAFIASVQNRTVITATVEESLKEQAFTNIDGAVIV